MDTQLTQITDLIKHYVKTIDDLKIEKYDLKEENKLQAKAIEEYAIKLWENSQEIAELKKSITSYKLNEEQKGELKKLNKKVINYIKEYLDLQYEFPNLNCYDNEGNFDQNKFNAILMDLGLFHYCLKNGLMFPED